MSSLCSGEREGEHLDLGELMHAIQAARGAAGGAGFGAVAMADAAELDRQFFGFDDLAGVEAAERDLGRGDEIQIVIFDAVDLRFRSARDEAEPLQHFAAGQVGRDHRREAFADQADRSRIAAARARAARLRSSGSRSRGRRRGRRLRNRSGRAARRARRDRATGKSNAADVDLRRGGFRGWHPRRRRAPRDASDSASLLWIASASAPMRSMSRLLGVLRFAEPAAFVLCGLRARRRPSPGRSTC